MAHAGGDVPVDGADVVAGLIFADLLEGDAAALEDAVIFAAEQILDGPAGPELQAANLAKDFAGKHEERLKGYGWFQTLHVFRPTSRPVFTPKGLHNTARAAQRTLGHAFPTRLP